MNRTNLLLVREATASVILGMGTPAHSERQDQTWNRVRSIKEVQGASVRNFLVRPLPSEEVVDDLYGDGYARRSVVQIWTSYCGIEDDADGAMIDDDSRQLYYHLVHSGTHPQSTGIIRWVPLGWVYEDETPGKSWGYHAFACTFLASDENATT